MQMQNSMQNSRRAQIAGEAVDRALDAASCIRLKLQAAGATCNARHRPRLALMCVFVIFVGLGQFSLW